MWPLGVQQPSEAVLSSSTVCNHEPRGANSGQSVMPSGGLAVPVACVSSVSAGSHLAASHRPAVGRIPSEPSLPAPRRGPPGVPCGE